MHVVVDTFTTTCTLRMHISLCGENDLIREDTSKCHLHLERFVLHWVPLG